MTLAVSVEVFQVHINAADAVLEFMGDFPVGVDAELAVVAIGSSYQLDPFDLPDRTEMQIPCANEFKPANAEPIGKADAFAVV